MIAITIFARKKCTDQKSLSSLRYFESEAWVCFVSVDDSVVALHELLDLAPPLIGCEPSHLIDIGGDKLLELDDIQAIGDPSIFGQSGDPRESVR